MKLYERFGERGYHTSIITSFGEAAGPRLGSTKGPALATAWR